jgi:DNA-binding transcriptional LysR family regulator
MINFNQLRIFYHAAKYQNFTITAKKLCITQPAVTAQVKLLEEHCSLKLFKKKGRKTYLTDEGKILHDYAIRIFEYEKEIEDVIEDMKDLKRGVLRLGTTKTYARYFVPFLMTSFHESYPNIKINLDEGSSLDMIYSLLDLRNEVAVIAKAEDNPNICFIPFSQEELVVILAPDHHLAHKKGLSFRELAQEPIIMKEIGSGTRKLVNELFSLNDCIPNILMETSNTEFIKQLVQQGEGISFVVREAVAVEIQEKKLAVVPLEDGNIFLDVSIAYLKDQYLSRPAQGFVDILKRLVSEDMPPQGIGALTAKILARRK